MELPADLQPLHRLLIDVGVDVRFASPPQRGAYGLYQPRFRRLWVSPLTKELGILRHTFIHEAVHAAQACPSQVLSPLGISTTLSPVVRQRVRLLLHTHYSHRHTALEKEAFEIQGRPDAVPLLIKQMQKRCSSVGKR